MQISTKTWNEYITRLSRLNQKAGQLMREYIDRHGTADTADLISYAYGLVTKCGAVCAELACLKYDDLAEAQGALVPAAGPAETASYNEVARMVNATKDQIPATLPNGVSRLVKRAGPTPPCAMPPGTVLSGPGCPMGTPARSASRWRPTPGRQPAIKC